MIISVPEVITDFLERHNGLLSQKSRAWIKTLRGIVRHSTTADSLCLQLVELLDEENRPEVHLSVRAKALCLLLTPSLSWLNDSPVHAELVNARQPLAGWLCDIANINWTNFPAELRLMAKELILVSWQLIPRRNDTVSLENYSRHLLEFSTCVLGTERQELIDLYPTECLKNSYAKFLANRRLDQVDRQVVNHEIQKRVIEDQYADFLKSVIDACQSLQRDYPKGLLIDQVEFITRHKKQFGPMLNLKMIDLFFLILQLEDELKCRLICTFAEGHSKSIHNPFQVHDLADLETLRAMQRVASPKCSDLAKEIAQMIRDVEAKFASCTCPAGECPCRNIMVPELQEPVIQ